MLQIIRGKLVIFLITLCLFVVYLGFDNNSNSDIVFYGHKTPKSVEIYLSEKNIIYKIINDQKISRGNGHFISIMVNNYRTHCGVVDINLNFFGNDSNLLIVFYVQIMPDDFVMQLHRF